MKTRHFLYLILIIGLLVSAYFFGVFTGAYSLSQVGVSFRRLWPWLLVAIGFQLLAHFVRAAKWRLLLAQIRPTKIRTLFRGLSIGYLFNTILPFRLGEFVRAHVVGEAMSISRTVVFCTIIFERAIDGLILGSLGLILSFMVHLSPNAATLLRELSLLTLLVSSLLLFGLVLIKNTSRTFINGTFRLSNLFNDPIKNKIRLIAWSAAYGTGSIYNTAPLLSYVLASIAMWISYILSASLLLHGLIQSGTAKLLALGVGAYLSVAVPSGPAYLGTFHLTFIRLLNQTRTVETAFTSMLVWMLLIVPIAIIGIGLVLTRGFKPRVGQAGASDIMQNKLYRDQEISTELAHFLDAYFSGTALNQILHQLELTSRFRLIKTFKGGSNASTLLAWTPDGEVVRKITLRQYKDKLAAQYQWLSQHQANPHMPRLLGQTDAPNYYSIDLEHKADYLPLFETMHSAETEIVWQLLKAALESLERSVYRPTKPADPSHDLQGYIDNKLITKVNDTAAQSNTIASLLDHQNLTINGRQLLNFNQIVDRIKANHQAMSDLRQFSQGPIHGDFTIDNIITAPDLTDYIILDPNNDNQISDPLVDYAKLMQSLHSGYEFLYQLKDVRLSDNAINFEESISSKYKALYDRFNDYLKTTLPEPRYRSLLFHEAVHYSRMLTYRVNINPDTLPAFYGVAVRLLNEFEEQYG